MLDRLNPAGAFRSIAKFPYGARAIAAMEPLRKALSLRPRSEVIPDSAHTSIGGNLVYDQRLSLPPNSILYAIAAKSSAAKGCSIQITDFGTGKTLFSKPLAFNLLNGGHPPAGIKNVKGAALSLSWPYHLLPAFRIIPTPGLLNVQTVNLDPGPNKVQIVLYFLMPPEPGAPRNEWNDVLDSLALHYARNIGGTITDPITGQPINTDSGALQLPAPPTDPALLLPANGVPFDVTAVGDNIIIPGISGYRIGIHELDLYNTAAQTIGFLDGPAGQPLRGPLVAYPGSSGYGLAYQPEPHYVCSDGLPFVLNLSAGAEITGFIKYRLLRNWSPGGSGQ